MAYFSCEHLVTYFPTWNMKYSMIPIWNSGCQFSHRVSSRYHLWIARSTNFYMKYRILYCMSPIKLLVQKYKIPFTSLRKLWAPFSDIGHGIMLNACMITWVQIYLHNTYENIITNFLKWNWEANVLNTENVVTEFP